MKSIEINLPDYIQKDKNKKGLLLNKVSIDIPNYSAQEGIVLIYEDNYHIHVKIDSGNEVVIKADKGGLIVLARQLLTLAQDEVPTGSHIHHDDFSSLDDGSLSLIISKRE